MTIMQRGLVLGCQLTCPGANIARYECMLATVLNQLLVWMNRKGITKGGIVIICQIGEGGITPVWLFLFNKLAERVSQRNGIQ